MFGTFSQIRVDDKLVCSVYEFKGEHELMKINIDDLVTRALKDLALLRFTIRIKIHVNPPFFLKKKFWLEDSLPRVRLCAIYRQKKSHQKKGHLQEFQREPSEEED